MISPENDAGIVKHSRGECLTAEGGRPAFGFRLTSLKLRSELRGLLLECPAQKGRARSEAGTHSGDQQEVALPQLAFFERGLHGDGNRACCRVAKAVDIDNDLLQWHAEALGRGGGDAAVG